MAINWERAARKHGVYQKLEVVDKGKDVRPVSVHTFTFYLSDGQPPLPDRHPYYTATGATPEEAEQAAYVVYMRAVNCQHRFVKVGPHLQKCQLCDVRLDGLQGALLQAQGEGSEAPSGAAASKPAKPSALKKLFGLK